MDEGLFRPDTFADLVLQFRLLVLQVWYIDKQNRIKTRQVVGKEKFILNV